MVTKKKDRPKIEMTVGVYDFFQAKELKKIDLPQKVFDGNIKSSVIHQVVVAYQAAKRSGTASTKTRGEVSGGGKKPWRQKGTGRARVGSSRNPLWKGGGTVFGPHPRDYSYTMPRRIKRLAVKFALNGKLHDSELFLIDEVVLPQPKTKILATALRKFLKHRANIDLDDSKHRSTMFIMAAPDINFKMAARNLKYVLLTDTNNFTAMDILLHKNLIISEAALKKLCDRITG
jgi:large subunit ribosomal protein L4